MSFDEFYLKLKNINNCLSSVDYERLYKMFIFSDYDFNEFIQLINLENFSGNLYVIRDKIVSKLQDYNMGIGSLDYCLLSIKQYMKMLEADFFDIKVNIAGNVTKITFYSQGDPVYQIIL